MSVLQKDKKLCCLSKLGILSFSGTDARAFLQGQITLDAKLLDESGRLAAYCDARGRVLATFILFKREEVFYAVTSKDLVSALVKRLRMYALRRDVKIDAVEGFTLYGDLGGVLVPANAEVIFTLPFGKILLSEETLTTNAEEPEWWKVACENFFPWVFAATSSRFIAQSINLDLAGAISTDKGCYVGQEVISRIRNLGTPSRRLALYTGPMETLTPGAEFYDCEKIPKGTLVYSSLGCALVESSRKEILDTLYTAEGTAFKLKCETKE